MTYLEKAMRVAKGIGDEKGVITFLCPEDFGFEQRERPCAVLDTTDFPGACEKCWNREIETTPSVSKLGSSRVSRASLCSLSEGAKDERAKDGGAEKEGGGADG